MSSSGLEMVVLVAPVHDCLNPVTIEPIGRTWLGSLRFAQRKRFGGEYPRRLC